MVFFYIVQTRKVECRGCETFIRGTYFTCTDCILKTERGYDLCCTCYGNRKFEGHGPFLDNYSILPSMRTIIKQQRETGSFPSPDAGTSDGGWVRQQSQTLMLQRQQEVRQQALATYNGPTGPPFNMQSEVGQGLQVNNMQIINRGDQNSKFRKYLSMIAEASSVGSLATTIAGLSSACSIM
ncbi:uncharacterized protein LOC122063022 isoform X2 [Macadamia integrifolia]|uniref:uncharacterized protein LOC122063022 isoform X2 n=1 Tax=Macadamia integrifolia TaxID=60698 RepID=UPI001C4EE1C9|nr:uncharacterized protein LOC122063022 isoform X2 [Macadamia integrifolia]